MRYFSFLCLAVVLATFVQNIFEAEGGPPLTLEKQCKALVGAMMKKQMGALSACTKKLKFKSGKEKAKKMNCILRCVMIEFKMMDAEGQSSPEIFQALVEDICPPPMHAKLNETLWPCMEIAFNGFKSLEEDEYCTTYDPFVKCAMAKVPTVCDGM